MAASGVKKQIRTDVPQPGRPTYTVANRTEDRAFDADTAVVAETNDVLATLIADLAAQGLIDISES
jgi:hypothetical protein